MDQSQSVNKANHPWSMYCTFLNVIFSTNPKIGLMLALHPWNQRDLLFLVVYISLFHLCHIFKIKCVIIVTEDGEEEKVRVLSCKLSPLLTSFGWRPKQWDHHHNQPRFPSFPMSLCSPLERRWGALSRLPFLRVPKQSVKPEPIRTPPGRLPVESTWDAIQNTLWVF